MLGIYVVGSGGASSASPTREQAGETGEQGTGRIGSRDSDSQAWAVPTWCTWKLPAVLCCVGTLHLGGPLVAATISSQPLTLSPTCQGGQCAVARTHFILRTAARLRLPGRPRCFHAHIPTQADPLRQTTPGPVTVQTPELISLICNHGDASSWIKQARRDYRAADSECKASRSGKPSPRLSEQNFSSRTSYPHLDQQLSEFIRVSGATISDWLHLRTH